jgi:hypothetical protein
MSVAKLIDAFSERNLYWLGRNLRLAHERGVAQAVDTLPHRIECSTTRPS